MEGNHIKNLKTMYNDIFSDGIENYWKEEGCNIRMQKYYKLSNILKSLRYWLSIAIVLFLVFMSTQMIVVLIKGISLPAEFIDEVVCDVLPFYSISFSMLLMFLSTLVMFRKISFADLKNYMGHFIYMMPMFYLILLNMRYLGTQWIVIIAFFLYLILSIIVRLLSERITELYEIATGEKDEVDDNKKEVNEVEVKMENKKRKGENKNARKR